MPSSLTQDTAAFPATLRGDALARRHAPLRKLLSRRHLLAGMQVELQLQQKKKLNSVLFLQAWVIRRLMSSKKSGLSQVLD